MNKMRNGGVIVSTLLGILAAGPPGGQAKALSPATHANCEVVVHSTEDAEKRLGGALYEGPMEGAQAMPGTTAEMPGRAGAHEVHMGQQGGTFFMAPNKINHIEARYSEECGIQVFAYNAFTEPISVARFQALVRIIPEDDSEWDREVIRFLSPAAGDVFLQARGDHDIKGPYKIELYVKFPESDDAEMFNIPVEERSH